MKAKDMRRGTKVLITATDYAYGEVGYLTSGKPTVNRRLTSRVTYNVRFKLHYKASYAAGHYRKAGSYWTSSEFAASELRLWRPGMKPLTAYDRIQAGMRLHEREAYAAVRSANREGRGYHPYTWFSRTTENALSRLRDKGKIQWKRNTPKGDYAKHGWWVKAGAK